jgi:hypothetical protein
MRRAMGWCLMGALATLGCSSDSDEESFDIGSATLSGKIGAASWTFVAGETDSFLSDNEHFWVDLYADPITDACRNGPSSSKNHVILSVPTKPGDYKLSLQLNATFVVEGNQTDNLVATRGRLVVEEVTGTTMRGKTHIELDADNEIDGTFQVARCP